MGGRDFKTARPLFQYIGVVVGVAVGVKKGSGKNASKKAGSITKAQVKEIAEKKMPDLNAADVEGAMKIIEGTARSMGVEVK